MTTPSNPFDALMASLDPPMVVVTAAAGGERSGCLVGFHSQSSIEPARSCVWLSKANRTYEVALLATHLGIHLLTEADRPLAALFGGVSGDVVDKFAAVDVDAGPDGVPVLASCPHRLVVRKTAVLDEGGDHVCFVTQPVDAVTAGPFRPLRLSAVADLHAGHEPGDSPHWPVERTRDA
jgi:flavin reductase (DIM6/NTAB) family NADH-FMN oxidoreductase RutF